MFVNRKDYLVIGCLLFTIILYFVFYKADDDKFMVANAPVLSSGMIPVIYDENNWIKVDSRNIDNNWYNYEDGKWANVVLVNDYDKYDNLDVGTVIDYEDIIAFYVWIPRYKYRIFNINKQNGYEYYNALENGIDIVFESGIETTGNVKCNYYYKKKIFNQNNEVCIGNNGDYYTHPAFTFGNQELNGMWVGKFETTGSIDNPTILPMNSPLRNLNIYNQFNTAKKFSLYLIGKNDSHMMKNIEWGAVAYLAHSKYGNCIDGCHEVRVNNLSDFTTGTVKLEDGSQFTYESELGMQTSTTGNITGIYDMSGGSVENVMANISLKKNKYTFNGKFYTGFNSSWYIDNQKYLDSYAYNEEVLTDNSISNSRLGDAMGETRGWYNDSNFAPDVDTSWIERGGNYSMGKNAGIFAYGGNMGYNIRMNGFRSVIVSG